MSPDLLKAAKTAMEKIYETHKAFGAPGDYGYETKEGKALYGLYQAGNTLQSEINKNRLSPSELGGVDWRPSGSDEIERLCDRRISAALERAHEKPPVDDIEITAFLYKHGDLTYAAASSAVQLLRSNGYHFSKATS